jgi:translocator assembly and maintenance protein 41
MVDFIFGVTHPHHWHSLNIQQNPHHYSAVRRFGSNFTTLVQDKIGAGVYFNPYVEIDGMVRANLADLCMKSMVRREYRSLILWV